MVYSIQRNKKNLVEGNNKMKDIETCKIEKMLYKRYKTSYSDCETIPGTYNKIAKTIDVVIPEGRMKKSGTRHQTYKYMWFKGVEHETNRKVSICIKATCLSNAVKRLSTNCDWEIK